MTGRDLVALALSFIYPLALLVGAGLLIALFWPVKQRPETAGEGVR